MKQRNKQKTVAEKVAELITQQDHSDDSESEIEATPRVVDFDEDEYQIPEARTTEFRKHNVKLLSEQSIKYKGKISSRKELHEDLHGTSQESSDDNDEDLKDFGKALRKIHGNKQGPMDSDESEDQDEEGENDNEDSDVEDDVDEEDNDVGEDDDDDNEEDDDSEENDDGEDEVDDDDLDDEEGAVISKVNRDAEIQKGLCVQNQLQLWERFLEMRIKSQKILSQANQLPEPNELKELKTSQNKNRETIKEVENQTVNLLHSLVNLQNALFGQFSEINKNMKTTLKRPSPFLKNCGDDDEPPLKQINSYMQDRFDSFRPYRNSVLLKWDDRTKLLQPGAGAKKKTIEEYDIIKKIDNTLMNKSMLIQKSQQLKNSQQLKSEQETENQPNEDIENKLNANIYDDSDFYHQQLRELIEYKANSSGNMSEVTKQYLELQKLRQKMKKKVDTRASKGRKLRYVVHNKLINFMAPHDNTSWTNESKDELCKSLFV
ncbi:apoptosis antagonizing transcription factor [Haematobia irritans]|uniref:apoptosis antagonizing transcription factor n=1 Tax=Haematobia irritans TaxID=7368 RepID=UPI003F509433